MYITIYVNFSCSSYFVIFIILYFSVNMVLKEQPIHFQVYFLEFYNFQLLYAKRM